MQNSCDLYVIVAVLVQVFVGQLFQCADSSYVLAEIAALTVADSDVLNTLLSRQQCLDDRGSVGDTGRNQCAGQRTVRLTVNGNTHFLVQTGQTVNVLPVADGALHGDILTVRQVVGDAAALIGGEATGEGDLGQQPCIGGAVTDLHGQVDALNDLTALGNTVVDSGEAIHHGSAQTDGLGNAVFCLFITVLTGVGVDGGRQQVCLAVLLQILHQLNVLLHNRHACTGLHEGSAVTLCVQQLLAKLTAFGHGLVVGNCLLNIHILASGPLGQDFLTQLLKLAFGNSFILNVHGTQAPFS